MSGMQSYSGLVTLAAFMLIVASPSGQVSTRFKDDANTFPPHVIVRTHFGAVARVALATYAEDEQRRIRGRFAEDVLGVAGLTASTPLFPAGLASYVTLDDVRAMVENASSGLVRSDGSHAADVAALNYALRHPEPFEEAWRWMSYRLHRIDLTAGTWLEQVLAGHDLLSDRDAVQLPGGAPRVIFKSRGAWQPSSSGAIHLEVRQAAFNPNGLVDLADIVPALTEFTETVRGSDPACAGASGPSPGAASPTVARSFERRENYRVARDGSGSVARCLPHCKHPCSELNGDVHAECGACPTDMVGCHPAATGASTGQEGGVGRLQQGGPTDQIPPARSETPSYDSVSSPDSTEITIGFELEFTELPLVPSASILRERHALAGKHAASSATLPLSTSHDQSEPAFRLSFDQCRDNEPLCARPEIIARPLRLRDRHVLFRAWDEWARATLSNHALHGESGVEFNLEHDGVRLPVQSGLRQANGWTPPTSSWQSLSIHATIGLPMKAVPDLLRLLREECCSYAHGIDTHLPSGSESILVSSSSPVLTAASLHEARAARWLRQLHRDPSIQSLRQLPNLQGGPWESRHALLQAYGGLVVLASHVLRIAAYAPQLSTRMKDNFNTHPPHLLVRTHIGRAAELVFSPPADELVARLRNRFATDLLEVANVSTTSPLFPDGLHPYLTSSEVRQLIISTGRQGRVDLSGDGSKDAESRGFEWALRHPAAFMEAWTAKKLRILTLGITAGEWTRQVLHGRDLLSDLDRPHMDGGDAPVVLKSMGAWRPLPHGHIHVEVRHRCKRYLQASSLLSAAEQMKAFATILTAIQV